MPLESPPCDSILANDALLDALLLPAKLGPATMAGFAVADGVTLLLGFDGP
jgi:hypothetical protein